MVRHADLESMHSNRYVYITIVRLFQLTRTSFDLIGDMDRIAWPTNMPSPSDSSSTSISDASSSDDTKEKEISSAQRALEFDESPLESEQNSFELILKSYDGSVPFWIRSRMLRSIDPLSFVHQIAAMYTNPIVFLHHHDRLHLSFISIRYTKRLAKKLADGTSFEHDRDETVKPLPVKRIKLIVEGPYGEGVRLEGYESGKSQ